MDKEFVVIDIDKTMPLTHQNFTGRVIARWTILERTQENSNNYHVKCSCGREYVRSMSTMLSGRANGCFLCHRKRKVFR